MKKRDLLLRVAVGMFVCFLAIFVRQEIDAQASSAAIDFSCSADAIRVGDVISVNLEISADVVPGAFEGYISYNDNVLEYVTGPECMAGGEGILRIMDEGIDAGIQLTRKYVLYFKAVKIGSCDISMRGNPEIYEAEMGYLMSVSSGTLTLDVLPDVKASSDASLAMLKVNTGSLEPVFSPDIYEYRLSVGNDVSSVLISALANDAEASVKTEGNTHLVVGQNRALIIVTAEDGTVQKYVIYITRDKAGESEDGGTDIEGEEDDKQDTDSESSDIDNGGSAGTKPDTEGVNPTANDSNGFSFYAVETDGEVVLNTSSRFTICRNDGSVIVPDGYFRTSVVVSGFTVTAYSPSEDLSGDYLLLILSKDGGKPGLYSFDRVEKTVQRFNPETKATYSGESSAEERRMIEDYEKSLSNMTIIISVLCGICMLLLIISVRSSIRAGKAERELEAGRGRKKRSR